MKRVSCNVAKALKEAGYPQEETDYYYDYNECIQKRCNCYVNCKCVAPTYLDVWLWLWREKKIFIELLQNIHEVEMDIWDGYYNIYQEGYKDPEEAIANAIDYLVDNYLIK